MNNNFLVYIKDDICILKLKDRLTMNNSVMLDKFAENSLNDIYDFYLEMSEVTYIDSTFLGLIAKLAVDFKMNKNKKIKLINPSSQVLKGFKDTGIINFLENINGIDFNNINLEQIDKIDFYNIEEKQHFILKMHEILMNLNEKNRIEFEPVVDQMRKVLK